MHMHAPNFRTRYRLCFLALIIFALPLTAQAQRAVRFPKLSGQNLEKKKFTLPGDLQGDLNIVLLAFQRKQLDAVDSWLTPLRTFSSATPGLRYYTVSLLQKTTQPPEDFFHQEVNQGAPVRQEWERTITLYADKSPCERALGIPNEDAIQILLMDRQGVVVWQGAGKYTAEKEAALTKAAQEWQKTNVPRIETLTGQTAALADFHGKPVLLILSGKGPAGAAARLLEEVVVGSGNRSDIVYATGADLTHAPSVLRGYIRDDVKNTAKRNNAHLIEALQQAGLTYDPQREPTTFLDWQGVLPRQFDVSGKTERGYQVFVLNREGKTIFRYEQPQSADKTSSPASQIIKLLLETVK